MRLYLRHIRALRFCASGAREWFARYSLDWSDFVANGIDAEVFERIGDHLGLEVVRVAREEAEGAARG